MATSVSSSQNTSTSEPIVVRTPENDILDQLSGVASGLASQMNQWAQSVFQKTSQVTDQAVGNFFQVSQKMLGLSNTLTDQYNNIFAPQNASLAREADSYNSAARQKVNMGMAGATQAQAGDAALKNSEAALRSYGIDPSSGRYAALDKAAAVQNAANVAGAENLQRDRDIATGQRLRSEAVQVGATLPAAISNVNNTAIQANTGASNASLANANTGANLNRLANEYLKTAMDLKLPPVGQKSQSQGTSSGFSSSPERSGGGGGSGGGSGGGGNGPGGFGSYGPPSSFMPQHGGGSDASGLSGGRRSIQPGSMASITGVKPGNDWEDPTGNEYDGLRGINPDSFSYDNPYGENPIYNPQDGYNMGVGQPGTNEDVFGGDFGTGGWNGSFGDLGAGGFGQTWDYGGPDQTYGNMGGGTNTEWGNISYDTAANNYDPGWGQTYDQPNPNTDWGNGSDVSYDPYSYSKGGPIDPSMSPSNGAAVDDVPAQGPPGQPNIRLNADEFVIPDDVAKWKGQEFFQNLIMQSRKKRMSAPAHGQQTPMR